MKKQRTSSRSRALLLVAVVAILVLSPLISCSGGGFWMKRDAPPDVDKSTHHDFATNSCWLASAANMLAGVGYGNGDTLQERADAIYLQMYSVAGPEPTGWPKTAMDLWLQYLNSDQSNPYDLVTYYGCEDSDKNPYPWGEENGPQIIGNELRSCQMVGLMIHSPTKDYCHAITAWGDDGSLSGPSNYIDTNPTQVRVTDSDYDAGGDVQTYDYIDNTNGSVYLGWPDGWYINYPWSSAPYIMGITTLCPVTNAAGVSLAQRACMSYSIRQTGKKAATGLHYKVGIKDTDILGYQILIGWDTDEPPTIIEEGKDIDGINWLTVGWDLSKNPVPPSTEVYMLTDFVLPYSSSTQNPILYDKVFFSYLNPGPGPYLPAPNCALFTPEISVTDWTDIRGGYVVGAFDIFDPTGQDPIGEYRFLQEYSYFQDPELHQFSLGATPTMDIIQVAAGGAHTVGLEDGGTVVAVGANSSGQCDVEDWTDITKVAAGTWHTVGLKDDHTVVAVGYNFYGQCDVDDWTDITQVAAGDRHTVGLKDDHTVVAVGYNFYGQCDVDDWTDITQVAAGGLHTVGLESDSTVVAVGNNPFEQCNVGNWTSITQVAAGADHTVGLKADGTVVAVGYNGEGQCDVGNWTGIDRVAAGADHTMGLKANGTVVAVGYNNYGQCEVGNWTDITQVSAGGWHTVGLKYDGTVVAVGYNFYGQCDIGWQCECAVGNLRFGHSYGFLDADHLWEFDNWMTTSSEIVPLDPACPIEVELDWDGRLPYPPGAGPMEP